MVFDPDSWFGRGVIAAVAAVYAWAVWITAKVFNIDKLMVPRDEVERALDKKHAENQERFDKIDEKQDELMRLMIDVLRR